MDSDDSKEERSRFFLGVAEAPQDGPSDGRVPTNTLAQLRTDATDALTLTSARVVALRPDRTGVRPAQDFRRAQDLPASAHERAHDRPLHATVAERRLRRSESEIANELHLSGEYGAWQWHGFNAAAGHPRPSLHNRSAPCE
jgi:hypothetical protein